MKRFLMSMFGGLAILVAIPGWIELYEGDFFWVRVAFGALLLIGLQMYVAAFRKPEEK